eukprot:m51a1_g3064 putative alpha-amylase family protein (521) ;mRNA; r:1006465-1012739
MADKISYIVIQIWVIQVYVIITFCGDRADAGAGGGLCGSHLPSVSRASMMISMRPYLYELGVSRLRDIPLERFDELRARGIDVIYLLGAWQLGTVGPQLDKAQRESFRSILPDVTDDDIIGSPFAVYEYTCNPGHGNDTDILWLRDRLHERNLALWLDFVPNHSALDSPWVSNNIDFYVRAPKDQSPPYNPRKYYSNGVAYGNCPNSDNPWTDVAQLNYWNPDTRQLMVEKLMHVAALADGIRCDVAYILMNYLFEQAWGKELSSWGYSKPADEFWPVAIQKVKSKYPNVKFMAEVYDGHEQEMQDQGFDYTYDKSVLDLLRAANRDGIRSFVKDKSASYLLHSAHFIENHDEDRAVATLGSWQKADAAALVSFTIPGLRFHWHGQWKGLKYKLDVHLRRSYNEPAVPEVEEFYRKFTRIMISPAFRDGKWTYVGAFGNDSPRMLAWRWSSGSDKRIVVINFSDQKAAGNVVLSDVQGSGNVVIEEVWSGVKYTRNADDMRTTGLSVVVDAWSAQIFAYP